MRVRAQGYIAWLKITVALALDVAIVAKGILPSFLVCGIIGGFLAWKFLKLGIFVLGALFGGALGYLLCVHRRRRGVACGRSRARVPSTASPRAAAVDCSRCICPLFC